MQKTSLAAAHALKCPRGSETPAVNPGCVCMADNFVNFSLWFGHVTNTRDDPPFSLFESERKPESHMCFHRTVRFSFPSSTTERRTPGHANANTRGNEK